MICRDFYTCIASDGSGDGVAVPNDARLNITGPITLGIWVYLSGRSLSAGSTLFGKWDSANGSPYMMRITTAGRPSFLDGDGATISTIATSGAEACLGLGAWHHLVMSRDENRVLRMYLNGVSIKVAQLPGATPIGVSNQLEIGSRAGGSDSVNGRHDEPFIYDRVLTPQEVWDIYDKGNYPEKPLLLMRFDEGVGTTAMDVESGNGWAGTLLGNARYTAQVPCVPPPVDRDLAGAFAGDTSGTRYVSFNGFNGALDGKAGLSVAAWVKPHQFQSGTTVLFCSLSTNAGANCSLGHVGGRMWGLFGRSASEGASAAVQTAQAEAISTPGSQWTLISGSIDYSGARMQLFVNGVLLGQNTSPVFDYPVFTPGSAPTFNAGSGQSGVIPMAALVADAMLFGRVLTKEEHRALYLYGNPPPTDLELRWKLNEPYAATVAIDSSGKGRHGTVNGVVGSTVMFQPGRGPFA